MKLLILRPLNRVKVMIWAKLKLGIIDLIVFSVSAISWAVMAFLLFDNPLVSAGVGILLGGGISALLIAGKPGRRVYNYFGIAIKYFSSKTKYKEKDISRVNPYRKIIGDIVYTKQGSNLVVYRILGNDISQNLDEDIVNLLASFENLFQSQGLSYQIVKQERKAELDKHIKSLKDNGNRGEEILRENKNIMKSINEDGQFYCHYFIEFSSSRSDKLSLEQEHVVNSLSECGLTVLRLTKKNLVTYLVKRLIPNFSDTLRIDISGNSINFEDIWEEINKEQIIKFGTSITQIGKNFQKTIAIDRLPLYTTLSFMSEIFNIENTSAAISIRNIHTSEAILMLNKAHSEMNARLNASGGKLSENKEQSIYMESMEGLMERIQGSGEELKAINCYITIFGTSRAKIFNLERRIAKEIKRTRMDIDRLYMKQLEIFMLLPLGIDGSIGQRNQLEIGSKALSHAWPFTAQSFNDNSGDYIGRAMGSKPCFLDWRLRDERLNRHQSNSVIFGTTGGGKTTFTKKLLKDEWSRGVNCYVMDPEGEYEKLSKKVGGAIIDLSGIKNKDGTIERLNPLQVFVGDDEENDWIGSHFKFLNDFFSQLLYPSLKDTVIQMNYLKFAIQKLYEENKITNVNVSRKKPDDFPTITKLHELLLFMSTSNISKEFSKKIIFQELSERLYDLTTKGSDGTLWDGVTTLDIASKSFVSFNFKNLINGGNARLIGAQSYLTYKYIIHVVFLNKAKAEREGRIQNVSVTIDEAHKFINPDNPTGVMFAFTMYKQIRKYHGWIRMTTQNIADFTADPKIRKETSAIINNSQFLFVFKLKSKDVDDLDELLKSNGGLTSGERIFLSRETSHQFLFISGNYRTAIRVDYTEKEKEIMGWIKYKESINY